MLDVASPMATSSQDVSRSGDHADSDTATTTPESTVLNNVGGPINQTPSSSSSYQLNPVSDSVTSGDLSSSSPPSSNSVSNPAMAENHLELSSLNAAQLGQSNPSAISTSTRSSQAADGAQLASTNYGNFGAVTQHGVFIGSDLRTHNPVSDVSQKGVLSGNGDLTMSQPSIQAVSSQAKAVANTLGSSLNIPQNGISLTSALDNTGSIGANTVVNPLGSNLNMPQNGISLTSGLDAIGSIGTNVLVNTLGFGTGISPISSLTSSFSPVQPASNTISDPLRQSSSTNNSPQESWNTPRISNGVAPSDQIEVKTATSTTGNCICNS